MVDKLPLKKLRCLVVDDEIPAHAILKNFIGQVENLTLVSTAVNALEAIQILHKEDIDLMFLDINMPRVSGLDMLESLTNPPKVILTTAYTEYAVKSYELNVVDYLLKPIAFPRFLKAINKVMELQPVLVEVPKIEEEKSDFIWIKTDKGIIKVVFDSIEFVKSIGNYVKILLKTGEHHVTLMTTKEIEDKLPNDQFMRIHRSFIINISSVLRINGNNAVLAKHELPIGALYRKDFLRKLT